MFMLCNNINVIDAVADLRVLLCKLIGGSWLDKLHTCKLPTTTAAKNEATGASVRRRQLPFQAALKSFGRFEKIGCRVML